MAALGCQKRISLVPGGTPPWLYAPRSASICWQGQAVGYLGELEPRTAERWDIAGRASCLEMDIDFLLEASPHKFFSGLPRVPAARRDMALAVAEEVRYADIEKAVWEAGRPYLEDLQVFDLYRGQQVGPGRKSLALSLRYRLPGRPLSEEEIARAQQEIATALRERFQAEIR